MLYKKVTVEIDLDDFDNEDLIDELEKRGFTVRDGEDERIMDDIFDLYKEWLSDQGDRDNRFEKAMRKFFEKHLNKVSV